jgi:adenylosuccinate synthase
MMSKLTVVVGGQYGSEAKGACAAYLARTSKHQRIVGVRVAGPNAGHTAYDSEGRKWALRQVPVIAVGRPDASLTIGAGSEIDLQVLANEVVALDDAGLDVGQRLIVDTAATLITSAEKDTEQEVKLTERIGSTSKGVGAARAARAMRTAFTVRDAMNGWQARRAAESANDAFGYPPVSNTDPIQALADRGVAFCDDTAAILNNDLTHRNAHVILEGTQGYGLGLHTQHYPQVTSSDCRAIDFLAMAGINPWTVTPGWLEVWVVLRVYPIRVAGNSGPLKDETSWEELGLPAEKTTVTNKTRRVGGWDSELASAAIDANGGPDQGPVRVWLSMVDQQLPDVGGWTGRLSDINVDRGDHKELRALLDQVEYDCGVRPSIIGTGPGTVLEVMSR